MPSKRRRLTLVDAATKLLALGLVFGPGVIYAGAAEPYIVPPPTVFGPVDAVILMVGGVVLLFVVDPTGRLRQRYWHATAIEAGLQPSDRGLFSTSEYTDTVRGYDVRATIGSNGAFRTGGAGGGAVRYTLVETELTDEFDDGVVIGPAEQDVLVTPYDVASFADAEVDGLVAASNSEGLAEAVLDSDLQDTLSAVDELNQLFAGNAKAVGDSLPGDDRIPFGTTPGITTQIDTGHDEAMVGGDWIGGTGWVSHVSEGTVLDPAELEAQIDAVVAVAAAFERAAKQ